MQYQNLVLAARSFQLTTYYSPYRICGMPGIYLDTVLPSITGVISEIISTISADGAATSQVKFALPKLIREEGKRVPKKNKELLASWLELNGWSEEDANDLEKKKLKWPFRPKDTTRDKKPVKEGYTGSTTDDEQWISFLRHRINNPEDSIFLNSWFEEERYFPNVIGQEIYKKIMYGIDKDRAYFERLDPDLDGSLGKFREEDDDLIFTIKDTDGEFINDNQSNTEWLSHFARTMQEAYTRQPDERKHKFINEVTRRRIITEDQFWKFYINLPDNQTIDSIGTLTEDPTDKNNKDLRGIRDLSVSIADERVRIINTIKNNRAEDSQNRASLPFIQERRDVIKAIKNELVVNGQYIIGT